MDNCPKCGKALIRKRRYEGKSWSYFWACPNFPECDGTLTENQKEEEEFFVNLSSDIIMNTAVEASKTNKKCNSCFNKTMCNVRNKNACENYC